MGVGLIDNAIGATPRCCLWSNVTKGRPIPIPHARPMLAETEASNPNRASLTATITLLFSSLAAFSPGAGIHRGRGP